MAHDVFISHASEDKQVAGEVCEALEREGIRCWIAPRDVPVGVSYEQAILDAIEASQFLVLVFSAHANASQHVEREIRKASEEGSKTKIFPFRVEDVPYNKVLYYYLGGAQWVDASTPPLEAHLGRLVEHVRTHLRGPAGRLPAHPTEVVPVPAPPRRTFLLAAGAGLVLLVIVAALIAIRPWGGGGRPGPSPSPNLATPAANSNANLQGSNTPQPRTPTPTATPTPRPMRTPIRVIPTNLNLRRPLNRNN